MVRREMRSTKEMSDFFTSRAFREIVRRVVRDIIHADGLPAEKDNR
jgi:hypothetical protein